MIVGLQNQKAGSWIFTAEFQQYEESILKTKKKKRKGIRPLNHKQWECLFI
jgi:hypothetical protein